MSAWHGKALYRIQWNPLAFVLFSGVLSRNGSLKTMKSDAVMSDGVLDDGKRPETGHLNTHFLKEFL